MLEVTEIVLAIKDAKRAHECHRRDDDRVFLSSCIPSANDSLARGLIMQRLLLLVGTRNCIQHTVHDLTLGPTKVSEVLATTLFLVRLAA